MAPNSLAPGFIRLDYTSLYAPHIMIIPTKEWASANISGVMGNFPNWNSGNVDAEAMIDELVPLLAALHTPDTTFSLATIFTKASPTAPAFPVRTKALTAVGTSAATGISKAIQITLNMKTTAFGNAKLVFLDAPIGAGQLDKVLAADFPAPVDTIAAAFTDIDNAWSGRDDNRPSVAVNLTYPENNKLRREYRMG